MFLLELNEFNLALTQRIAKEDGLAALSQALNWKTSLTSTEDRDESGFLEPWAQWVSVHTGEPCSKHGIKHLGDVPNLASKQLWEQLSTIGVTSGIWGVMNGSKRNAENCLFFVPDPWTFSEDGYPAELGGLLELPRYLARNYLNVSATKVTGLFGAFLKTVIGSIGVGEFLKSLGVFADGFRRFGARHLVFIAWFEYVSSLACLKFYARHRPQFCLLFVNTVAHVQHHYWRDPQNGSAEIRFALKIVDRLIALILAEVPQGSPMIITNALSQKNTNEEATWVLYRQNDPISFFKDVGISSISVEPLMSYDAHVVFASARECAEAAEKIAAAKIEGKLAFFVERDSADPCKLFYRIDFNDEASADSVIEINGGRFRFYSLFSRIVKRTGRHIPSGVVLSRGVALPSKLPNHKIFECIVDHFSDGERLLHSA